MSFLGSHTPGRRVKPPTSWESSEDSMKGDCVELNLEERAGCDQLEKDTPGGVSHTGDKIEGRWSDIPRGCRGCHRAAARMCGTTWEGVAVTP